MGQKAHPTSLRLGYSADWKSRWLDLKNYSQFLLEDQKIREFLMKKFQNAGVSMIEIERKGGETKVNLHTARPGVVIGRGGSGVESVRKELKKIVPTDLQVNIIEVRDPERDAAVIASGIVNQLERRLPFRRVIKGALENALKARVQGIKVNIAGRLNGADIARTEKFAKGTVPLHTLRKKIDFASRTAKTTFGTIGVKVWVYKGEEATRDEAKTTEAKVA